MIKISKIKVCLNLFILVLLASFVGQVYASQEFQDNFAYFGSDPFVSCVGNNTSTSLRSWSSPGHGNTFVDGSFVTVTGEFSLNLSRNAPSACGMPTGTSGGGFKYSYDIALCQAVNCSSGWTWLGSGEIVPSPFVITTGNTTDYTHILTLNNQVQIPSGTPAGSNYRIGYILRHYYDTGGSYVQVRAASILEHITISGVGPTPTPTPPAGSITLSGNSTCIGSSAYVDLSWSSSTGDSTYDVFKDGSAFSQAFGTSWTSAPETQGETHSWQVRGQSSGKTSNSKSITTATCSSPLPGGWWLDAQSCTKIFSDRFTIYVMWHLPAGNPGGIIEVFRDRTFVNRSGPYYGNTALPGQPWGVKGAGLYQFDLYVGGVLQEPPDTIVCGIPPPPPTPTPSPPPPPPPPPGNLSATPGCNASNQPQITFTWTDSTGEDNYSLDVNLAAWTGPSTPSPWGVKTLGANVVSFVWSPAAGQQLDSGTPTVPANSTTYWWRLKAHNTGGDSLHMYDQSPNPDSSIPPGVSVTTPNCGPPALDLKARFVKPFVKQVFNQNEDATVTVRVSNVGGLAYGGGNGVFGFWPNGGPSVPPNASSCTPTSPPASPPITFSTGSAGNAGNLPAIGPGLWVDVTVTFNVGTTLGVANAFVLWNCSVHGNDVYWPNNHTSGPVNTSNPNDVDAPVPSDPPGTVISSGGFTYTVSSPAAWFETLGGDVGSSGDITAATGPAANRYQSAYLIAGNNLDVDLQSARGWKLGNYNKRLIPTGGTYNYLADRFRQRAIAEGHNAGSPCQITAGQLPPGKVFGYCSGSVQWNANGGPNGNQVWFIDGNLTISRSLAMGAADTATFIVGGNIIIEPTVERIDGIYVAGGTFTSGSGSGPQLLVNGAVYANSANLNRILGGSCGAICNNTIDPAERIVFDLKYLVGLNTVLGSPAISWKEVAP